MRFSLNGGAFTAETQFTGLEAGSYSVLYQTEAGCVYALPPIVLEACINDRQVYFPNIFSPNFDGINDYFLPFLGPGVAQVRAFSIYSRWGELVFERRLFRPENESDGWDGTFRGKPALQGVYGYMAEIEYADGAVLLFSGDVHLVR